MNGEAWRMSERIKGLLKEEAGPGRRTQHLKIRALQEDCAKLFGEILGLKHTETPFTTNMLARQATRRGRGEFGAALPLCVDHPYFYKETGQPYRARAIACHNYGDDQTALRALAEEEGLEVEKVDWFPSWWYPERTTLFLLTPKRKAASSGRGPFVKNLMWD